MPRSTPARGGTNPARRPLISVKATHGAATSTAVAGLAGGVPPDSQTTVDLVWVHSCPLSSHTNRIVIVRDRLS